MGLAAPNLLQSQVNMANIGNAAMSTPLVAINIDCTMSGPQDNSETATNVMLRHGRDVLPTWDSIVYWERGTKGPGSGF